MWLIIIGLLICIAYLVRKLNYMKWIKNLLIIACVYSLALGVIYFIILPVKNAGWEQRQASLNSAEWLAVPVTILVIFLWSKLSKKFNL